MNRLAAHLTSSLALGLLAFGCQPTGGGAACSPGQISPCACPDGTGQQRCDEVGNYSKCQCDGGPDGGLPAPTADGSVPGTPCAPDCVGRACGDDGCGATCGECADDTLCDQSGACVPRSAACGDGRCGDD